MKTRLNLLLLILILVSFSNPLMAQSRDFAMLEDTLKTIMDKYHIPGIQVAFASKDSMLWLANIGYSDIENKVEVNDKTMFRIGSVSKSFVAVAVMKLVEEGKLNLNDKLKDLAPEVPFTNKWEETHPVRLVHLLEHTTGFDDLHPHDYATNGESWTTLQGIQYNPVTRTCRWEPGKHTSYCNGGPPIAAYVVEKVTGQRFEDYVKDLIFSPLNMKTSTYFLDAIVQERLSKAYVTSDYQTAPYWHIIDRAAGSINSTALEMANYLRFYLGRGRFDSTQILNAESIDRMEKSLSTLAGQAGVTEGYGLYLGNSKFRGIRKVWHGGGMEGFLSSFTYFPTLDIGFVLLVNQSNGGMQKMEMLLNNFLVTEEMAIPVEQFSNDVSINPEIPGWYRSASSRNGFMRFIDWPLNYMKISHREDGYFIKVPFKPEVEIYPVDANSFILEKDGDFASVVFMKDENDDAYVQLPDMMANYKKSSGFSIWFVIVLGIACLAIMATNPLVTLFWLLFRSIKALRTKIHWSRIVSIITVLMLVAVVILFNITSGPGMIQTFGTFNATSFSIFLLLILFALGSVLSVYGSFVSFKSEIKPSGRIYTTVVSCSCFLAAVYLTYWDIIGRMIWAS